MIRYLFLSLCAFVLIAHADEENEKEARVHVDLSEVVAAGAVSPVDGITSAGQPDEVALSVFASSGYTTVIDMRGPAEDRGIDDFAGVVETKGMDYVAFPITSADQFSLETARELDDLLDGIDGPVLLHCGSGNRVGGILALRHKLSGASDEEALEYGRNAGMTGTEAVVRQVLTED